MPITTERGTSSDLQCWQVQPTQLLGVWEEILPHIDAWCKNGFGEMIAFDVFEMTLKGIMQIFIFHTDEDIKFVLITELVQYPRLKALRFLGVVGVKTLSVLKFLPAVERWGIVNGATVLESFSTSETEVLNKRIGLSKVLTLMRKDLIKGD